jgi:hypothetical protein
MSPQIIKFLIAGALFVHGLAHARAFGVLLAQSLGFSSTSWVPVRAWLFPSLAAPLASAAACIFWLLSTAGFLAASLSFWGILLPGDAWRQLALASSVVSLIGIALFSGIWPGSPGVRRSALNTAIALTMNIAILVTLLWLHWPPEAMFGK